MNSYHAFPLYTIPNVTEGATDSLLQTFSAFVVPTAIVMIVIVLGVGYELDRRDIKKRKVAGIATGVIAILLAVGAIVYYEVIEPNSESSTIEEQILSQDDVQSDIVERFATYSELREFSGCPDDSGSILCGGQDMTPVQMTTVHDPDTTITVRVSADIVGGDFIFYIRES